MPLFGANPVVTTKGDVLAFDTAPGRFPAGAAATGNVLIIDTSKGFNMRWDTPGSTGVVTEPFLQGVR